MNVRTLLTGLLLSTGILSAATLNDVYFGLDQMRGFSERYWWFRADGKVLAGLPTAGLAPADFDAACQKNTGSCGTYTLNGDQLAIRYQNGQTENYTYKTLQGGMQLNYMIYTPVKKFSAGTKLNGTWSRASATTVVTSSTSGVSIVSPRWLTFQPDGTFSERSVTGIDTVSAVRGANTTSVQQAGGGGTYSLKDYQLTLTRNGKAEQHLVFPVAGDNLNIDGQVYTKQK